MKIRLISLVLCLMLLAGCMPAMAEAAALSRDELTAWREQLLKDSLLDETYTAEAQEDGTFRYEFTWYTLIVDTARLSSATRILAVEFEQVTDEIANTPADIRGLRPGDSIQTLLAAWPNENESLAGTREEAVLYQTGSLPGQAAAGTVKRDGQRIESVIHSLYAMTSSGVSLSKVTYALVSGYIDTIEITFDGEMLTLADAQSEMAAILDLQAITEFSAFISNGESIEAEIFNRDDLLFSGMDFLSVTPEQLTALLGDEYAEQWSDDGDRRIRVMEWHALTAAFTYTADGSLIDIDNLSMDEDLLIGPRGLVIGDTLDVVLGRFRYEATDPDGIHTWLYGHEGDADYAVMDSLYPGQAELRYALTTDGQSVMMILYVNAGVLERITLQML